jgi:hypothetical protein
MGGWYPGLETAWKYYLCCNTQASVNAKVFTFFGIAIIFCILVLVYLERKTIARFMRKLR